MKIAMAIDSEQRLQQDMQHATQIPANPRQNLIIDIAIALVLAIAVAGLTMLWFSFDHHFPAQDEAEHIMNSMACRDLLRHIHPFSLHWWYQVLTVNRFYPPLIYLLNGFFLLAFGQTRFVDQAAMAFFTGLMVMTVYAIVRVLSGARLAACISALCICMYPLISSLSHSFFLDLPEVAMTSAALLALLWWRSAKNPNWKRTLLCGIIVGIACLAKQLVAAYLIPVGLYYLIIDIGTAAQQRVLKTQWIAHTFFIGLITLLIGLPFIVINYQFSRDLTNSLVQDMAAKHIHVSYIDKVSAYWQILPQQMSALLFAVFLFALVFVSRRQHLRLLAIGLSALGGLLLTCALPGFGQSARYLAPFLIAPAIYTGFLLANSILTPIRWQQFLATAIIIVASVNCMFYNFVPYPFDCPQLRWLSSFLDHRDNPIPSADWGHSLVLETIERVDGNKPVYLNVLTNLETLHGHAFELLLKEEGNTAIKPTSSRFYTIVGDRVRFSPATALYNQWYLWKTGSVGYKFYDKQSEDSFKQLVDFIRHSGNYKLMAQKALPDGSQLMLFRQKT